LRNSLGGARAGNARIPVGVAAAAAACLLAQPGSTETTTCSVFDAAPCAPTFCSVLDSAPCRPDSPYLFGDGLRVTIEDRPHDQAERERGKQVNTLQELWALLGTCWVPPPLDQSKPGTEITIRFSVNRAGAIIGEPRFTYSTPTLSAEVKSAYQKAVAETLARCTPFPLSNAFGGAIAGRPIAARFIDDRGFRRTENRHER
jgi:hypothetical protein